MSEKLWGGRFSKTTDEMINEFQASIGFDRRMYREDIAGSIAHAAMLAKVGILSEEDRAAIEKGLKSVSRTQSAMRAAACTRHAAATIRWHSIRISLYAMLSWT